MQTMDENLHWSGQATLAHSWKPIRCRAGITDRSELEDADLLNASLAHDENAWFEFVRRFQPFIAAVIAKTLRRSTAPAANVVDDLVQETYLKLCANNFKALRQFDCRHEHALAGFLKVVASNVTQDYLRGFLSRKRGGGKGEDDIEKAMPKSESVASSPAVMEQAVVLRQIETHLHKQYSEPNFHRDRKIFWLYYRNGLTADAIARFPGIGLTTKGVESVLFRLTELLRNKLRPLRRGPQTRLARAHDPGTMAFPH